MESTNTNEKKDAKPKDRTKQREKRKFDMERNNRTIFIGNLPSDIDQKAVIKIFKDCGPVESARIRSVVPEKEKLAPKVALITKRMHPKVDSVNAYLVFKDNKDDKCIEKALKLNGNVVDGHHLRVDRAQRPKAKRETLTSRKKSVFVGNLRFDLRDDDLINHFEKAGKVNYVRIVRDSATGLGKGFGFVAFHERAAVKEAIKLNDTNFKGRQIRVKKVEEEKKGKDKKGKDNKAAKDKSKAEDEEDKEVEDEEVEDEEAEDEEAEDEEAEDKEVEDKEAEEGKDDTNNNVKQGFKKRKGKLGKKDKVKKVKAKQMKNNKLKVKRQLNGKNKNIKTKT